MLMSLDWPRIRGLIPNTKFNFARQVLCVGFGFGVKGKSCESENIDNKYKLLNKKIYLYLKPLVALTILDPVAAAPSGSAPIAPAKQESLTIFRLVPEV